MAQTGKADHDSPAHAARQRRGAQAYHAGLSAEEAVLRRYLAAGYVDLEQRWRGPGGEIDLIFLAPENAGAEEIVFVEVKASKTHGRAADHLKPAQLTRLCASAEAYLGTREAGLLTPMRLDVALVDGTGVIEVLENILM